MENNINTVKEEISKLLELLSINVESEVVVDEENEALTINLNSPEMTGLLIGARGETLRSLQYILSIIVKNKLGDWQRILINVADWREKEEERLKELTNNTVERVVKSGESIPLYNLTPAQRRTVHLILKDNSDVETVSEGEGEERHLIVKPK